MLFHSALGVAFTLGPLTIRWYGIIISAAMLLGMVLAYRETERQRLDTDFLVNLLLLLIPAAIIGARLYYVLFNLEMYLAHPAAIFAIWRGGLAIHGGVIAGALIAFWYCRRKTQSFLRWVDVLAPSLILGQAIGRWGNFANQEAYGPLIEAGSLWEWVPLKVLAADGWHHPTFLYESVWNILVFVVLLVLIRRPHRVGSIFASYLIFYSIGRFFIESLRTDSLMLGPFRVAMVVSGLGVVLGAFILWKIEQDPIVDVSIPEKKKAAPRTGKKKKKR